jgi:hypothetical protein
MLGELQSKQAFRISSRFTRPAFVPRLFPVSNKERVLHCIRASRRLLNEPLSYRLEEVDDQRYA